MEDVAQGPGWLGRGWGGGGVGCEASGGGREESRGASEGGALLGLLVRAPGQTQRARVLERLVVRRALLGESPHGALIINGLTSPGNRELQLTLPNFNASVGH